MDKETNRVEILVFPDEEERWNMITHVMGAGISVVGAIALLSKGYEQDGIWTFLGYLVYSVSLFFMYFSSAYFHFSYQSERRYTLNKWDHVSVFLLMGGTYSAIVLSCSVELSGWLLLVWVIVLAGTLSKIFFFELMYKNSTKVFVLTGSFITLLLTTQIFSSDAPAQVLFYSGYLLYLSGAILCMIDNIRYNHLASHVCILLASVMHFFLIYTYL